MMSSVPTFAPDGAPEPPAETTDDPKQAGEDTLAGDGVYEQDRSAEEPITDGLARIVTREGGRIPIGFEAAVQNEGYARGRDWAVFAPADNPYHLAAAVVDYLNDRDAPDEIDITVERNTAADTAETLRATNLQWALDGDDPATDDRIEEVIEWLRYSSAYSDVKHATAEDAMPEIVARLREGFDTLDISFDEDDEEEADEIDPISSRDPEKLRSRFFDLTGWPHDAWDYRLVTISIHEAADDPTYV